MSTTFFWNIATLKFCKNKKKQFQKLPKVRSQCNEFPVIYGHNFTSGCLPKLGMKFKLYFLIGLFQNFACQHAVGMLYEKRLNFKQITGCFLQAINLHFFYVKGTITNGQVSGRIIFWAIYGYLMKGFADTKTIDLKTEDCAKNIGNEYGGTKQFFQHHSTLQNSRSVSLWIRDNSLKNKLVRFRIVCAHLSEVETEP